MVTQVLPARKGLGDLTSNNLGQVKKIFGTLYSEKEISEYDLKEAVTSGDLSKMGHFVLSSHSRRILK
jgi:hypothetical protein